MVNEKGLPDAPPAKTPTIKWVVMGCLGALAIMGLVTVVTVWLVFRGSGLADKITIKDGAVTVDGNKMMVGMKPSMERSTTLSAGQLAQVQKLEGWYRQSGATDFWQLSDNDGELHVKAVWGEADMVPSSATEFTVGQWGSKFIFETAKDGSPKGFKEIKDGKVVKVFTVVDIKK